MAEFDELLVLIKEHCTAEQIKSVLRTATTLLGAQASHSPSYKLKKNGYVIADIRPWGRRKPLDWAAKFYGHETQEEATDEIIQDGPNRILRVYERREHRYVLMARWNAPDFWSCGPPRLFPPAS